MKKRSFALNDAVYIQSGFTIVGPKEGDSAFAGNFDIVLNNDRWCESSYEKCECKMHRNAVYGAIKKAGLTPEDIDIMLSGDLLNEIMASGLTARSFPIAFLGLYNACSTFGEAILVGSMLIDGGFADTLTCSTSSHYATAERQYRFPLELGNQRPPTAQWTVTGAGCTVLSRKKPKISNATIDIDDMIRHDCDTILDTKTKDKAIKKHDKQCKIINCARSNVNLDNIEQENNDYCKDLPYSAKIVGGTIGRVVDLGIEDASNMGAAMAPSAADTIITHFRETGRSLEDYDGIYTGDLGRFGKEVLEHLLAEEGIVLPNHYADCGADYFRAEQKTFQGGSGTGCVSTVFNGHILKQIQKGNLRRVLVVPTGALLSKDTPLQHETIPGIAHAFVVEAEKN